MPQPGQHGAQHGPDRAASDRLGHRCILGLIRAYALVDARLSRLFRDHGLTGAGFDVLVILDGAGRGLTPHDIGERRLVTSGTMTGLLDTLERQGFVRRTPHPDDRRCLLVELTDGGGAVVDELRAELGPAEAEITARLTDGEMRTLAGLLERLRSHLAEPLASGLPRGPE